MFYSLKPRLKSGQILFSFFGRNGGSCHQQNRSALKREKSNPAHTASTLTARPDVIWQLSPSSVLSFHGCGVSITAAALAPISLTTLEDCCYTCHSLSVLQEHLVRTKLPPNPSAVFQSGSSRVFNIWRLLPFCFEESTREMSSLHSTTQESMQGNVLLGRLWSHGLSIPNGDS